MARLRTQDWEGAGHPPSAWGWLDWLLAALPWLFLAALVALVARALLRGARFRALDVFDEEARARVRAALAAAEARTSGEIVPVILERSDRHPAAEWIAALGVSLGGTGLLAGVLPWERPALLVGAQLALGALGFALARLLPDFKRWFVRAARATEMCEEQALQEFHRHELQTTAGRNGVLLFVSLFEQRVIVLADEGIASEVEPEVWVEADRAILAGVARGDLAGGLILAIERVGDVLAEHAPGHGADENELPDHLVVRRE